MTPLEIRLAMKAHGFVPTPCEGKRPTLAAWQTKTNVSAEEMARWAGPNTGIVLGETVGLDADIAHPEAAAAVEEYVAGLFDGRGRVPIRFGNRPKRATLLRTAEPFAKMAVSFTDPSGAGHKIEVLGKGQQIIVHGTHPDTGVSYTWFDGCPWIDFCRDDLVEVTEQEMRNLLDTLAEMLEKDFGFTRVQGHGGNGQNHEREAQGPVDLDAELQAMTDGKLVNDVQIRIIPSLLRNGEHPDDVLKLVVDETIARVGARLGWTPEREARYVIPRKAGTC